MLGPASVFASPAAEDWLTLLVALEQPRQGAVRQAALTCFVGWTFADLAAADDDRLSDLDPAGPAGGAGCWPAAASPPCSRRSAPTSGSWSGCSADSGGERRLTDLRHLGQSLHAAMVSGQLGVSALVEWLRDRMAEARASTDPRARDGWRPTSGRSAC